MIIEITIPHEVAQRLGPVNLGVRALKELREAGALCSGTLYPIGNEYGMVSSYSGAPLGDIAFRWEGEVDNMEDMLR